MTITATTAHLRVAIAVRRRVAWRPIPHRLDVVWSRRDAKRRSAARPCALRCLAAALFAVAACAHPAVAGDRVWTPIGPDGGRVWALAVDPVAPDVVYAGTDGTVFRSDDGAESWTFAGSGLPPSVVAVRSLLVHGGAVYAGTEADGAWKSLDRGQSWLRLGGGLPSPPLPGFRPHVGVLVADPRVPARLWAGTRRGVFFTTDGGSSWTERSRGLPLDAPIHGLAIDPQTGRLYACNRRGVFISNNAGKRWTKASRGLNGASYFVLLVDPSTSPSTVLVGSALGVWQSRNQAASWNRVGGAQLDGAVLSMVRRGSRILAGDNTRGTFFSDDRGDTWTAATTQPGDRLVFAVAAAPTAFIAGTFAEGHPGGVFRSRDDGRTWQDARRGLTAHPVDALSIHPSDPNVIYAGAGRRNLFETADGGATWDFHDLPVTAAGPHWLDELLVDVNPIVVLASNGAAGLFRSHDAGTSWTRLPVELAVETLVRDPRDTDAAWAAGFPGVYYTANGGDSWQRLPVPGGERVSLHDLLVDPRDARILWAGGFLFEGSNQRVRLRLFRSADGGQTWQRRETGLGGFIVLALTLDPPAPDTLYAGTDAGLFRSTDAGQTWTAVAGMTGQVTRLLSLPTSPTTFWAIVDGAPRRSPDGGQTWLPAATGLAGAPVVALVADPTNPRRVFAGTTTRTALTWTDTVP